MKKILRKDNNQGSSLALVMVALMIIAVAVVSFQTSIASFVTRTMTQHYEKQAYLSARSVAESVAKKLEDDSYNCMMQLSVEERKNIVGLPNAMYNAPQSEIKLTSTQVELLGDVRLMKVDETIDLGEIQFEDHPDELEVGTVSANIQKSTKSQYIIEAKADVKGEVEIVKALLNAEYYELKPDDKEEGEGLVEVEGNWSGFYTDFGLGPMSTGGYGLNNPTDKLVIGTSSYHKEIGQFQGNGNIYTKDDITLDGVHSSSGAVFSEGSITLKGANQDWGSTKLVAKKAINITAQMSIHQLIYCETLKITGNGVNLSTGPFIAETVIIEADNIQISGDLRCNTLYVKGNSIQFGDVYANEVKVECGVNGNEVNWGSIRAQQITIQEGVHGWTNGGFFTPTGTVSYGSQIYGDSGANGKEITGSGYRISVEEVNKLINITAGLEDELNVPYRTKPIWATYEPSEVKLYERKMIGNEWYTEYEKMGAGYYHIGYEVGKEIRTETVFEDGQFVQKDVIWNVLDIPSSCNVNGNEKLCIIVRDKQNLEVNSIGWELEKIYFILEGNAKIHISSGGQCATRVYGESVSQSTYDTIQSEINIVVEEAKQQANGIESNINYAKMQREIDNIMEKYWDDMSGVILADNTNFCGSLVVPYIKLKKNAKFMGVSYPAGDNELTDQEASTPPEGTTGGSGGGTSGGSSGGDSSNPSGGSGSGSGETRNFILFELEAFTG